MTKILTVCYRKIVNVKIPDLLEQQPNFVEKQANESFQLIYA